MGLKSFEKSESVGSAAGCATERLLTDAHSARWLPSIREALGQSEHGATNLSKNPLSEKSPTFGFKIAKIWARTPKTRRFSRVFSHLAVRIFEKCSKMPQTLTRQILI
jgi:hypothetical protein